MVTYSSNSSTLALDFKGYERKHSSPVKEITSTKYDCERHCCVHKRKTYVFTSVSTIGGGGDTTIPSPGRSPKQPLPGMGLRHPHMVGKLAPNSTHFTTGLVKYIPGRGYFRAVPSQNGDKFVPSPPPLNRMVCVSANRLCRFVIDIICQ